MDAMDQEMTKLTNDMRSTAASILAGAAPSTRRIPLTKAIRDYAEAIAKYFEDEAETRLAVATENMAVAKEDSERFKSFAQSIRTQGVAIAAELAELLDGTARKMQAEYHED